MLQTCGKLPRLVFAYLWQAIKSSELAKTAVKYKEFHALAWGKGSCIMACHTQVSSQAKCAELDQFETGKAYPEGVCEGPVYVLPSEASGESKMASKWHPWGLRFDPQKSPEERFLGYKIRYPKKLKGPEQNFARKNEAEVWGPAGPYPGIYIYIYTSIFCRYDDIYTHIYTI